MTQSSLFCFRFCPCFLFYLISVVPALWLLEIDRVNKYDDLINNDNITDKAMKAGDKLYHEEHFTCTECGTSLADPSVATYTKNESLYCQQDYMKKFVPICAKCDQYITQVISWIPQGDQ